MDGPMTFYREDLGTLFRFILFFLDKRCIGKRRNRMRETQTLKTYRKGVD